MSDTPQITLPASMLPEDGRFGCGPSRIRPAQVDALTAAGSTFLGTSHRQAPVKNMVGRIREALGTLFRLPDGYEIILGDGGATAFWNAAAFGLVSRRAQAVACGEFSSKFAKAVTTPWLETPSVLEAPVGSRRAAEAQPGIDVYAWPHNETSTGVSSPIRRVAGADPDALIVIDGTSAAGGIDFSADELDVYYFSPQKNFASEGGLWLAAVSPRAIERIETIAGSDRYIPEFLNLRTALTNSRLNQTLNTPSLSTLLLLDEQLQWMLGNGGLSWADARTHESSGLLYSWAESDSRVRPFVENPEHRSPVVVTIDFDDSLNAAAVAAILRAHGVVDVEPYRKLGRNQLRIGTFVAVEPSDVEKLIACIQWILDHAGDAILR